MPVIANRIDEVELEYLRDLIADRDEAMRKFNDAKAILDKAKMMVIAHMGFLKRKYNLNDLARVETDDGVIYRNPVAPTPPRPELSELAKNGVEALS